MILSDGSVLEDKKRSRAIGLLFAFVIVLGSVSLYLSDFSCVQDPSLSVMVEKISSWFVF